MNLRIEDYAMIGDTRTACLVGHNGSIDWACMPRFDSHACFAALLGTERNGYWKIAPRGTLRAARRCYRDSTMILETTFVADGGEATVIDFMPIQDEGDRCEVIRIVRGDKGTVPMHVEMSARFDYGSVLPWTRATEYGLNFVAGPDAVKLWAPMKFHTTDHSARAEFDIGEGDCVPFYCIWHPSNQPAPEPGDWRKLLSGTESWWRDWVSQCTYDGEWRDQVVRSLVTVKALSYRPTGGIAGALTTSLPEKIGGQKNWDYRMTWIRDATFTLYALMEAGYREEAAAWREWLLRAVAGNPNQIQPLYGICGERRLDEHELSWLDGYEGSTPVRVGNASYKQFQLDVFGEILNVFWIDCDLEITADGDSWQVQSALMNLLETEWDKPDHGIWEVRGKPRHFTHSKVMAWAAVDRYIKLAGRHGIQIDTPRWSALRDRIHAQVCDKGYHRDLGSFVQYYGGTELDSAVLMIPMIGFLPADDPRVLSTVDVLQRNLIRDGFLYRDTAGPEVHGVPGSSEGAFLPVNFWLVDVLTQCGRREEARALLDRLLSIGNDVGLFSEEYDPKRRRLVGNFPQAFTHVAMINAARNLQGGEARKDILYAPLDGNGSRRSEAIGESAESPKGTKA